MKSIDIAESVVNALKVELVEEFDEDRLEIVAKERNGDDEFPYIVVVRMQIRDLPWMVLTLVDRICYMESIKHESIVVPYGISTFTTKDGRFIFEVGIR